MMSACDYEEYVMTWAKERRGMQGVFALCSILPGKIFSDE